MADSAAHTTKPAVIILGAGVSGLSAGLQLQRRGHAVTLLDRGDVGAESSWAGGGILAPLLPWDYAEPLSALALRSMMNYAGWVDGIESHSDTRAEYVRCGMEIQGVEDLPSALDWCDAHNLMARFDAATRSVRLPDIAQVRNPYLVAALSAAIQAQGGVIHTQCAAEAVTLSGGRVTGIRTNRGLFTADRFVLATGAWAGLGLPGLAGVPNVRPIRGQMLLFKLAPGVLDTILYRKGLYLIPRLDGHVLAGSTVEDVGFDKTTETAARQRLHAAAAALLPALASIQPIRHWAGLRPGSPDNLPIIDRHPDFENVFVNTGHFRYGVTLAPASAELLADLMEGTPPALAPLPYSWKAARARSWKSTA